MRVKGDEINNNSAPIRGLRADVHRIPKPYRDVARGMEQQFIQYMVEQMKRTIDPAKKASSALKYYHSVLNRHQADMMAKNNEGLGLQKVILDQIYPIHKRYRSNPNHGIRQYEENTSE